MGLLFENFKLEKGQMGGAPIVIVRGDVFAFKDLLKNSGAKWNGAGKFWFWFVDKNDPKKTIDKIIKPALETIKNTQNIVLEIDKILADLETESPSSNPDLGVSKEDEDDIKKKLQEFKERLVNIQDDEQFKETMGKIIAMKSAQGYQFSFGNAILIMIQDINAGIVNSKKNWLEKYNRTVNSNARPLMVWAPQGVKQSISKDKETLLKADFLKKIGKGPNDKLTPNEQFQLEKLLRGYTYATKFKFVPVYSQKDTTQIEGTEDYIKAAEESKKDIKWFEDNMISDEVRPVYKGLIDFTEEKGIKLELTDDLGGSRGSSASGAIQLLKNEGNDVGLTKTLAHEITHELLHQKYLSTKGDETSKFFLGTSEGRAAVEQQAELSAWMFMYAFGFDLKTTSLNYVLLWGGDKDKMVRVFDTVSGVVNYLIDFVNKKIKTVDEGMGSHTNGKHITPDDIAKALGVEDEFREAEKGELKERLTKKLNEMHLSRKVDEGMFGNLFGKKDNTIKQLSDEEIKQQLVNLANSERTLIQFGKQSNPKNTDEVTYTDLNDTKIKDDFTPYYQAMKNFLSKNNNITVNDTYNNKTFNFQLQGDTIMATKTK
jgi:hypothetical protein